MRRDESSSLDAARTSACATSNPGSRAAPVRSSQLEPGSGTGVRVNSSDVPFDMAGALYDQILRAGVEVLQQNVSPCFAEDRLEGSGTGRVREIPLGQRPFDDEKLDDG